MNARRLVLTGAALLGGGVSALALGALDGGARVSAAAQTTPTVPTIGAEPFTPNQPFAEPPVVKSRDKRLTTTLLAKNGSVTVSGLEIANTQTYAAVSDTGSTTPRGILGPTLHVRPGDTIDLTLDNQLTKPDNAPRPADPAPDCSTAEHPGHKMPPLKPGQQYTNLHFHGLHVTPLTRKVEGRLVYGDNVLLDLQPGPSEFEFKIPKNHPQGTYWYHAHRHMCTDDQVYRGLAGLLIIGDSRRALPRRFRKVRTRSLALKDVQVDRDETTTPPGPWAIPADHDWGTHPTHRTVNGLVNPVMQARPGETQLWRVANTSAAVWYKVALVDEARDDAREPFQIVAQDGNTLPRPIRVRHVVIAPGHRVDMLVRAPTSGSRALKTLAFDQGRVVFAEDYLAMLELETAPPAERLRPVGPHGRLPAFPKRRGPARRFVFSIKVVDDNAVFLINGKQFSPTRVDADPKVGTVERWTLVNNSTEWHPFHIHQDDFRIVSINGKKPPAPDRGERDVVALPPVGPNGPGKVVIDMPFTDFTGNFVFHCHILDHEDGGMMARVKVRP